MLEKNSKIYVVRFGGVRINGKENMVAHSFLTTRMFVLQRSRIFLAKEEVKNTHFALRMGARARRSMLVK